MQEVEKFFKTNDMVATATDSRIHRLRKGEKPEDNYWVKSQYRGQYEENALQNMNKHGFLINEADAGQSEHLFNVLENMVMFYLKQNKDNQEKSSDLMNKSIPTVVDRLQKKYKDSWGNVIQDSDLGSALQQTADIIEGRAEDKDSGKGISAIMKSALNFTNWVTRYFATGANANPNDIDFVMKDSLITGSSEQKRRNKKSKCFFC
ncbi:hypothetical protein [Commensalibacter nepenthis]|uniref:Uncharacterized protein n=1 Tax=Commensalibacter nepenthis TaxID=3043872 RepID=A0ABT6QA05_9PROT|nr:hypothetical protein [Commensalibacter sp. TBRC 10068]MDI2113736.1 hypothetical protein [Commensalibacter sp. TBRC 10068]